jgi:glycosyltransferase involved in cell wall biosynthesis
MRFSILIPTFNRANLLGQAIDSALAQTHSDREIVVIDDGSTDNTEDVASSYGQQIRYLRKENAGKPAALNVGISASTGDIIIVLDDDDYFPPWTLAKHAEALERNPAADFSYGRFVRFQGHARPALSVLQDMETVPANDPRRLVVKLMENCFLPNPTWAVRRSAQLKIGPYNERLQFSQDYDMILRLARENEGAFVDDVVLFQRKHLARRGPISEPTYVMDSVNKWLKYDVHIFEKIDREWEMSDFCPFLRHPSAADGDSLAPLQKGIILFQRKAYDGADRALSLYRRTLGLRTPTRTELRIATGLLGCRYGVADIVAGGQLSEEVVRWLRGGDWPLLIRIAFASQQRWRIKNAWTMGDLRYAFHIVQFSCKAFGMDATAAILGSRYRAGAQRWKSGRVAEDRPPHHGERKSAPSIDARIG